MIKGESKMDKKPLISKWLPVGIILLFVGIAFAPAMAQNIEKQSASRGTWLYVGGSGPGNYTRIQDAINNANQGDTVFVYEDSSPYNENLVITTSITLFGEDRNTTIINGKNSDATIRIRSDEIIICGFTIQHGGIIGLFQKNGIEIRGNSSTIQDNIIQRNRHGIALLFSSHTASHNHCILNNIIQNNWLGGILSSISVSNVTISGNDILTNGDYGIGLSGTPSTHNTIVQNIISGNGKGIILLGNLNIITENTIQNSKRWMGLKGLGIKIIGINNSITRNNLINNSKHAYQEEWVFNGDDISNMTKEKNVWDANYWGEPLFEPKLIYGRIYYEQRIFIDLWVPWNTYDEHPAQEPYDFF
jgi:parallel beta-helix repeat protein